MRGRMIARLPRARVWCDCCAVMWPCNCTETSVCHTRHAPYKDIVPLAAEEHTWDGFTFMLGEQLHAGVIGMGDCCRVWLHSLLVHSILLRHPACTSIDAICCSMLGMHTTPRCDENHYVSHEGELQESTREALRTALPWALRFNPAR